MVLERLKRMLQIPKLRTQDQPPQEAVAVSATEPRIIGLAMVKNEQDIIELFIRHNARFLDALVMIADPAAAPAP